MNREIVEFVSRFLICQQIKVKHHRLARLSQLLSMNFVMGLSRTQHNHDNIWVIGDRLTKSAHFLPLKVTEKPTF